jgi:hypothetical protein
VYKIEVNEEMMLGIREMQMTSGLEKINCGESAEKRKLK